MVNEQKLKELNDLATIPTNCGEQFINIDLCLGGLFRDKQSGTISYGLGWKRYLGEYDFRDLDQAIAIVKDLRKRANLTDDWSE